MKEVFDHQMTFLIRELVKMDVIKKPYLILEELIGITNQLQQFCLIRIKETHTLFLIRRNFTWKRIMDECMDESDLEKALLRYNGKNMLKDINLDDDIPHGCLSYAEIEIF